MQDTSFGEYGELLIGGKELFDNTKLQAYACETRGKLGYEEHLIPNEPAEALVFGGAFHKAAEDWTNARLRGESDPEAIGRGEQGFVSRWNAGIPVEVRKKLELDGDRRSLKNFRRLFQGYREKFPLEIYTKIHGCEIPFTLPLGETPRGVVVYWSGIIDRVVTWMDGLYYRDTKTTSYPLDEDFFDGFRRSGQLLGYAWAGQQLGFGEFAGVVVEGIKVEGPLKTKVRDPRDLVEAEVIPLAQAHLVEWREHTLQRIDDIHRAREREFYTMNNGDLCKQYRGGCQFRQVCNALPRSRDAIKEMHFRKRVWSPFNPDGI